MQGSHVDRENVEKFYKFTVHLCNNHEKAMRNEMI